jgi:hypothetical protein
VGYQSKTRKTKKGTGRIRHQGKKGGIKNIGERRAVGAFSDQVLVLEDAIRMWGKRTEMPKQRCHSNFETIKK